MGKLFYTDEDKMYDIGTLSKEEFLDKYYYINSDEYDVVKNRINSIDEIPSICNTKYGNLYLGFLLHKKSIRIKAYKIIVCLNKGILNKDNIFDGIDILCKDSNYDEWYKVALYVCEKLDDFDKEREVVF